MIHLIAGKGFMGGGGGRAAALFTELSTGRTISRHMQKKVLVIGTGAHARVVAEVLRAAGRSVAGFVAPADLEVVSPHAGIPVRAWDDAMAAAGAYEFLPGIGDNRLRAEAQRRAEAAGAAFCTVVHPSAVVGSGVTLGPGTVVAALAALVLDIAVGRGVIVNTRATIDHDGVVGDWCHVAPGAVLAGNVRLGEGVFVGAGAVIIQGRAVGARSTVGAGAVVIRDVPQDVVVAGVPAEVIRHGTI